MGLETPDFTGKREACAAALEETLAVVGDTPIAIDYTYCPRPLGLAKLLLDNGFNVKRVYLDTVSGEEKCDFTYLKENHPIWSCTPRYMPACAFGQRKKIPAGLPSGRRPPTS